MTDLLSNPFVLAAMGALGLVLLVLASVHDQRRKRAQWIAENERWKRQQDDADTCTITTQQSDDVTADFDPCRETLKHKDNLRVDDVFSEGMNHWYDAKTNKKGRENDKV